MRRFAEIVDGTVTRVITAHSVEWCEQALGGTWLETFTDGTRVHRAAKGYTYDSDLDAFIPPKKFESWVLDVECACWEAPDRKSVV